MAIVALSIELFTESSKARAAEWELPNKTAGRNNPFQKNRCGFTLFGVLAMRTVVEQDHAFGLFGRVMIGGDG
jgi:hypothetical protein